ncbi:DJ-1/PfpI family protein [Sulfuriferula sp. GW1]|uniref:DJ-1/PfpI family protein n=1 Tax=Sulfuriferula sp. GW1 TaxID=3345111 RepID=UPI0039B07F9D
MTYTVGIFVFDDVEVLDFAGPYEVFTTASRMNSLNDAKAVPLFKVFTIGRTVSRLQARAGLSVFPDHDFAHHPEVDVLIIPGGVVRAELARPEVLQWIADTAARSRLTASVCTGAFLLAGAGLLDGRCATTHWEDIGDFHARFPAVKVKTNLRWVDEDRIVTSAGISAGIDMSLHLVERLSGRGLAVQTARQMDFDWTENA